MATIVFTQCLLSLTLPFVCAIVFFIPVAGGEELNPYGSLVITWAGVIDDGEGNDPPHGPYGSLHVLVYEISVQDPGDQRNYPKPLSHVYLNGPTKTPDDKYEWLDGDEKEFPNLEIFRWRKQDDEVAILVYESDPSAIRIKIPGIDTNREHDRLFYGKICRMDTVVTPLLLSSANVRLATGEAVQNSKKRESTQRWVKEVFAQIGSKGTKGWDGSFNLYIPAMFVKFATVNESAETTKDYR